MNTSDFYGSESINGWCLGLWNMIDNGMIDAVNHVQSIAVIFPSVRWCLQRGENPGKKKSTGCCDDTASNNQ